MSVAPIRVRRDPAGMPPPHDLAAERAVLSAAFLDNEALSTVLQRLRPGDYYAEPHGLIHAALRSLVAEGAKVDTITTARQLASSEHLGRVGGPAYLSEIVDATPAIGNVSAHAEIVIELSRRRRAIAECQRIAAEGYGEVPPNWLADSAVALVQLATPRAKADPWKWISGEALTEPVGPVPWLVRELQLGPGRPNSLQAFGGGMKTLAAQSALVSLAADTSVWGTYRTSKPCRCRHIDLEQGSRATRRRYQRLALGLGVELAGLPIELSALPRVRLTDDDAREFFMRAADGADIVLLDSLAASLRGVNENDNSLRCYLDLLTEISEQTGVTWWVLHHVGKAKDGHADARQKGRGASALFDAWGTVLDFSKEGDFLRYVEQTKVHLEAEGPIEPFFLEAQDVPKDNDPKAGVRVVAKTVPQVRGADATRPAAASAFDRLKEQALTLLRSEPQPSKNAICCRISGGSKSAKLEAIAELEAEDLIRNVGGKIRAV